MLDCQNSLVKLSIVVLLNSLEGVLWSLVDDCGRAQELAELVPIELALSEFADLLKESLKDIIGFYSYLEIIVADSLFVEVSHLESSASLERLGLNDLLNLGRSVGRRCLHTALLASVSESSFTSC